MERGGIYKDDLGAAHERIRVLEEALERSRQDSEKGGVASAKRSWIKGVLLVCAVAGALLLLLVLVAMGGRRGALMAGFLVGAAGLAWAMVRRLMYTCAPNEALVFSGRYYEQPDGSVRSWRVAHTGRHWRWPLFEQVQRLDLTVMSIEVQTKGAYSKEGIPLNISAWGSVRISIDAIDNAIERFLGRRREEISEVAREILEGTLRGVLATMTPQEVQGDQLILAQTLSNETAPDMQKLGLQLEAFKIQQVSDDVGYLESLGRSKIAAAIRDAEIAESDNVRRRR